MCARNGETRYVITRCELCHKQVRIERKKTMHTWRLLVHECDWCAHFELVGVDGVGIGHVLGREVGSVLAQLFGALLLVLFAVSVARLGEKLALLIALCLRVPWLRGIDASATGKSGREMGEDARTMIDGKIRGKKLWLVCANLNTAYLDHEKRESFSHD